MSWRESTKSTYWGFSHAAYSSEAYVLNRSGNVIAVSSTAAQRPGVGQAAYASSKARSSLLSGSQHARPPVVAFAINAIAPGLLEGDECTHSR